MPYIINTSKDQQLMLESIGLESIEQLFDAIPEDFRLQQPLDLPAALSEMELEQHLGQLASRNHDVTRKTCFLGGGSYDHFVPAVVDAIANRSEFSDIVRHASKRFGVHLTPTDRDPWSQLDAMMGHFTDQVGPMSFDDLEAAVQQRATRSVFPTAALFTGAGTSAGTGVAAKAILSLTQTPIGRLLPFVPKIGPWFTLVARSAGVASVVSGPLAIGLGVLAINQAMGTNYRKLLPLLIGIGALQAHRRVIDAEVVPSASPTT